MSLQRERCVCVCVCGPSGQTCRPLSHVKAAAACRTGCVSDDELAIQMIGHLFQGPSFIASLRCRLVLGIPDGVPSAPSFGVHLRVWSLIYLYLGSTFSLSHASLMISGWEDVDMPRPRASAYSDIAEKTHARFLP